MKFPLSWLKEFVPVLQSPEQIAEILTLTGLEVEGITKTPSSFSGVIVGKVVSVAPHPNAERLVVAQVSDGKKVTQVVCGAPNCKAGMKVAFATVGAQLKDEKGESFTIKKAKLRGVESEGMLCSHEELGLSLEPYGVAEGIVTLPDHFAEGSDLSDLLADVIFEVSITPNLSHCLCITGIARELSAATGLPLTLPGFSLTEDSSKEVSSFVSVSIKEPDLCPRYACRTLTNIKVGPSQEWIQERLKQCGIRPINVIVDATNYAMMELGQPLHAFDLDMLDKKSIVVRLAHHGESLLTLDDQERFPNEETLVICDASKPIAIAGIMGGKATEVSEKTTSVLLESAYFEPTQVRRASKRMGMSTEASKRFERGTDPNGVLYALDRAASLIQNQMPVTIASGTLDLKKQEFVSRSIACRISRINRLLGTHLSMSEVESIFQRLGLAIISRQEDALVMSIPTYRHDIQQEIDLIEEVARLYGYDHLHHQRKPVSYQGSTLPHHPLYVFEQEIRNRLIGEGLQEFLNCNLISPSQASWVAADCMPSRSLITLLNPSSAEQSVLRPSLLPTMLHVVKYNLDHAISSLAGFEVGKIHFKKKDQYLEPTVVSIILTGDRQQEHWKEKSEPVDFYDLKGIVENLLVGLKVNSFSLIPSHFENFHPGRQARILIENHDVGILGEIHPTTLKKADISQPVYFAELNVEDLMQATKKSSLYQPLPAYPASLRDWTLTIRDTFPMADLLKLIQEKKSSLLEEVSLLDIFKHEKLGADWKNITLRFIYRALQHTVSHHEVDAEHARMTEEVTQQLKKNHQIQL